MYDTTKVRDELALVHPSNPIHELLITEPLLTDHLLVFEGRSAYELPAADAYARRMVEEAERWLRHARERSRMKEETLIKKALHALAFSLQHRAHDLAIPSKLVGTAASQKTLWHLVRQGAGLGLRLDIEERLGAKGTELVVLSEGEELGEVQPKHAGWFRPLVPFGAGVHLVRITGQERDYTLGVNVCFARVGAAVAALNHALGQEAGAPQHARPRGAEAVVEATPLEVHPLPDPRGDGAPGDPDDVVLWRDERGLAHASVEHAVRHSPTGVEWGYLGSGAADLARSVLLAFTDEATADRLYVRFKEAVVARVPREGGVIRARDVRAWIAAHEDRK